MAETSGSTRWWESYLVRYFLPSIAGMFIIRWLALNTDGMLTAYLPVSDAANWKNFGTPHLVAWLLFGTLYCYVASYPCLVFHATRVLDFKDVTGNYTRLWSNPYVMSLLFTALAYDAARKGNVHYTLGAVGLFSLLQLRRLYLAYAIQKQYGFTELGAKTSLAYAFLSKLSKQRSILMVEEELKDEEGVKGKTTGNQKKDLADSYRHLREHGNTAFIFMLELALCPILFLALTQNTYPKLPFLAVILVIWIAPSVCTHGFGQHLERRYSLFKHN